ncbi:MAG: hypothetical protein IKJ24_05870 [Clostridia bacterium]|nr:hypothetical protein [Clostridia bacterium]
MKLIKKENIIRVLCLLLAVALFTAALASCANEVKDPIMEYDGEGISLEMYEFVLSRMKGSLARLGYDVSATSSFWTEMHGDSGLTNEEFYTNAVIDTCKNYLAALAMCREEGIELSDYTLEAIDEEIAFTLTTTARALLKSLTLFFQSTEQRQRDFARYTRSRQSTT